MHRIALIGASIGESLSPALHLAEAAALGLQNYRYELFDIAQGADSSERLLEALRDATREGFTGFNITHPYKQAVIPGLDGLSPEARRLYAVNSVTVSDGVLIGHNTDYSGFLAALRQGLGEQSVGEVLLVGAGGAGAAVAQALLHAGASRLSIVDAEAERSRDLARNLSLSSPAPVEALDANDIPKVIGAVDGLVNATPIGMKESPGSPVDTSLLTPEMWVGDVIYRPFKTELLRAAELLGCSTVLGTQMLVDQAADTFELLTAVRSDRQRMREHMQVLLEGMRAGARQ